MSPHTSLFLAPLLVSLIAGCANAAKPMEAPVDMNLAEAGQTGENPFAKSFVKRDLPGAALQHDPQGPKVYRGEDQVDDYQRMLENGYDMVGYSEFVAGADVPPALLEQHASSVNADVALVYTRLAGEVPASVQVQQLREQVREGKTPNVAAANAKDSYKYFASYWAKLAPPLLGVHVTGPAEDSATDGLKVIAVINESPADKAGIQNGDVLKRVGEVELKSPSALSMAAQRYAGQTVDVDLQREALPGKVSVTLNAK